MYKVFIDSLAVYFAKKAPEIKNIFVEQTKIYKVQKGEFNVVLTKILDFKDQNIDKLVFITENVEELWLFFKSNFQHRIAGGGVVFNKKSNVLMIYRNEKWDLPKGHLDNNETIEACAIREVEEECGIVQPKIVKKISVTYHTYEYKGKNVLKENHWFLMSYDGEGQFQPQIEEGITEVAWKTQDEIKDCLQNSYGSIQDVIEALGEL
ncbi:MAG: NUDIX domain-containing protein [Flavobacteriales bacterium]|jgi:8-oxo-dGTP pyrophosphatase MutT (NUDIX family)|nr:NUDIX domain-containing protein [Flavobacteriales bacterium]